MMIRPTAAAVLLLLGVLATAAAATDAVPDAAVKEEGRNLRGVVNKIVSPLTDQLVIRKKPGIKDDPAYDPTRVPGYNPTRPGTDTTTVRIDPEKYNPTRPPIIDPEKYNPTRPPIIDPEKYNPTRPPIIDPEKYNPTRSPAPKDDPDGRNLRGLINKIVSPLMDQSYNPTRSVDPAYNPTRAVDTGGENDRRFWKSRTHVRIDQYTKTDPSPYDPTRAIEPEKYNPTRAIEPEPIDPTKTTSF